MIRLAAGFVACITLVHVGDNPLAEFLRSLHTPDGRPCCSMDGSGDCFEVGDYWPNPADPGGFIARHNGEEVRVPREAVQAPRADNPFETAVLCLYYLGHSAVVRCFVPPSLTE